MADASLVVAIVSLLVAGASAAFSVVTWWRSGSLVRIENTDGYPITRQGHVVLEPDEIVEDSVFVSDSKNARWRNYRVINVGRQPVAVLDWWLDFGGPESRGLLVTFLGAQTSAALPTTLEPGHLIELAVPLEKLKPPREFPEPSYAHKEPRLAVRLGTGNVAYSERRSVRSGADTGSGDLPAGDV